MRLVQGTPVSRGPFEFATDDNVGVAIGSDEQVVHAQRYCSDAAVISFELNQAIFDADEIEEFIVFLQQVKRALVADGKTIELPVTQ